MVDGEDKWDRLARLSQKPSKTSNRFAEPSQPPVRNLKLLAIGYLLLTYSIIAQIAPIVLLLLLTLINAPIPEFVMSLLVFFGVVSGLGILASLLTIAVASQTILTAILVCFGFMIPCVNIVVVIVAYTDAKETLERNGVKIGFFGVDFDSIP